MNRNKTIVKNLKKASKRLKEAAILPATRIHKDAVIQRFEFCFELSWKAVQTFLREEGLDCKSPRNCFRIAADLEIISDPVVWLEFLEARNLIAHTYNEKLANRVYKKAIQFPIAIDGLLKALAEKG
jgi:nucleotidyltransferase substrate binding protein (TIGR01987 family)